MFPNPTFVRPMFQCYSAPCFSQCPWELEPTTHCGITPRQSIRVNKTLFCLPFMVEPSFPAAAFLESQPLEKATRGTVGLKVRSQSLQSQATASKTFPAFVSIPSGRVEERVKGLDRAETDEATAFIEGSGRRMSELDFGRRERRLQTQRAMRDSCIGTLS